VSLGASSSSLHGPGGRPGAAHCIWKLPVPVCREREPCFFCSGSVARARARDPACAMTPAAGAGAGPGPLAMARATRRHPTAVVSVPLARSLRLAFTTRQYPHRGCPSRTGTGGLGPARSPGHAGAAASGPPLSEACPPSGSGLDLEAARPGPGRCQVHWHTGQPGFRCARRAAVHTACGRGSAACRSRRRRGRRASCQKAAAAAKVPVHGQLEDAPLASTG
jgi:hypothetical protein